MKTISNIKKDLEFNGQLSSLLEVLKTISVSQFRSLEHKIKTYEKYLSIMESFFEFIDVYQLNHFFLKPKNKLQVVIAITSDSGLLGGLNMQVINTALSELQGSPGSLIVVGSRGKAYAQEMKASFSAFGGIREEQRYAQAMQLRDYVIKIMLEKSIGYLKVIYPRPISFTVQRVEKVFLLPYAHAGKQQDTKTQFIPDVIFESNPGDIMEYLAYLWVGQKIYEIFGLSRLAEFAARFVHLEGSHQRLKEMDEKMRLQYFRVRHEIIDRNMRELFSARQLFK